MEILNTHRRRAMKKLRLQVDELRVETFEAGGGGGRRGTVHGRYDTQYCGTEPVDDSINYCSPPPTSLFSCDYTCGNTCSCGCTNTCYNRWTCDPYQSACTEPVYP
jgi:hypothetical protein